MKRKPLELILLFFIIVGFCLCVYELFSKKENVKYSNVIKKEYFDPSLLRLSSISTFSSYCDSLYGNNYVKSSDTEQYVNIVSQVLRLRFYHGYSYYSFGQNSLAYFLAFFTRKDLNAIVIPDDILKHPMAACSQQSIIGMETFKKKGFNVRKVGFFAEGYGGHFCYEVFFQGKWHFFDPDMEPSLSIMAANHFPSISEIAQNDSLLDRLYYKLDAQYVNKLFKNYFYGPINKFPAPHAIVFQYITKYLSLGSWLIFILIYWGLNKRRNNLKKKEKCAELRGSLAPKIRA